MISLGFCFSTFLRVLKCCSQTSAVSSKVVLLLPVYSGKDLAFTAMFTLHSAVPEKICQVIFFNWQVTCPIYWPLGSRCINFCQLVITTIRRQKWCYMSEQSFRYAPLRRALVSWLHVCLPVTLTSTYISNETTKCCHCGIMVRKHWPKGAALRVWEAEESWWSGADFATAIEIIILRCSQLFSFFIDDMWSLVQHCVHATCSTQKVPVWQTASHFFVFCISLEAGRAEIPYPLLVS